MAGHVLEEGGDHLGIELPPGLRLDFPDGGVQHPCRLVWPLAGQGVQHVRHGHDPSKHLTWHELPTVQGDAAQLQQALQNLLTNALKFARPGVAPEVHVSAARERAGWHVTVQDNGIGIEPQYFERIFKVFQRLHRHDQYDGTGIGLAVVARVIERHGGRVWVTSTPGEGGAFHFTLPDRGGT